MSRVQPLRDSFVHIRRYTDSLLDAVGPEDYFRLPPEGVTHIGWQVGHLAVAEYGLALKRVRGAKPEDAELIPPEFFQLFGKGSQPTAEASDYPSPEEIRGALNRVHAQVLKELETLPEETLDEVSTPPHPMFKTKGEALKFCPYHEMVHAGQIGLLRRMLGHTPLR